MDFPFIPKKLVTLCDGVIAKQQRQHIVPGLSKTLLDAETMVFVVKHADLLTLMRGSTASIKASMTCLILSGISFLLTFVFSWWFVAATVSLIVIARYYYTQSKKMQNTLAAILLALEMMANDFAGLSDLIPGQCKQAREVMQKSFSMSRTHLMDTYFADKQMTERFETMLRTHAAHVVG